MLHYLAFVYSPFTWIIFFLVLAFLSSNKTRRRRRLLLSIVLALVFTNPLIYGTVSRAWQLDTQRIEDLEPKYDVGIVFGGYLFLPKGTSQIHFALSGNRLLAALQLYRQKKIKRILLSGGFYDLENPDKKEAPVIKEFLIMNKVAPEDILMDPDSRNTYENTSSSIKLLKDNPAPALLISSNYHLRRSIACYKKQGFEITPFACGTSFGDEKPTLLQLIIPSVDILVNWKILFHEMLGMVYYRMRGYL